MTRIYASLAVLFVALMLGTMAFFVYRGTGSDPFADCREGIVAGGAAAIGGPFELTTHTGNKVSEKDVITGPTLVYFGYSFCPDVCPLDNARNAEVAEILKSQNISLRPVFVSVDPARDTPEQMAEYVGYFSEDMLGLSGTPEQIKAAAQAYKVYYRKASEDEHYLVDHSTFTYLMHPEHGFLEFYKRAQSAEEVAESVACFIGKT